MKILLTNDDGVHAPGINILYETLKDIADVYVVAPLEERSTTGHTLTLDHPLRLAKIAPQIYGCSGFPADCSLIGIAHLLKDSPPDLVISGINKGANMGQDIYYSGTVAAAREASYRGIPSIAVSLAVDFFSVKDESKINFDVAANFIKKLVLNDIHKEIGPHSVLNVNVPDLKTEDVGGAEMTELGHRYYSELIEEREDFRNRAYYWIGGSYQGFEAIPGTDCVCLDQDNISLSSLKVGARFADKKGKWSSFLEKIS